MLVWANIDRSNCNRCSLTERSVAVVITMRVTISFTCFTISQLGKAKAHALVGTTTKQCLWSMSNTSQSNVQRKFDTNTKSFASFTAFVSWNSRLAKQTNKKKSDPEVGPIAKAVHYCSQTALMKSRAFISPQHRGVQYSTAEDSGDAPTSCRNINKQCL